MKIIKNGVCAPKGFKANGIHCGIRKNKNKKDLALITSEKIANTANVYTKNIVKCAPILITKENVSDGVAQAIICNSGNANACYDGGLDIATKMCEITAKKLDIKTDDVIVASTGVIGQQLLISPIQNAMSALVKGLGMNSNIAAEAILTTDLVTKEIAVSFKIDGYECKMGAIAKGSGMIHPNMGTLLCFITTDVDISSEMLQLALDEVVKDTFNMVSVDGDTSTNDMVSILANGLSGNNEINSKGEQFDIFKNALNMVMTDLAKKIAADGEGATKLLICNVVNANSKEDAKLVSKSVICSSLFKAAMFGKDANWGRVLCAIGYSKANLDINKINVSFASNKGSITVCKNGGGVDFSEDVAKEILSEKEITVKIDLSTGKFNATAYGCDLTYDYVKINGDYRS